MKISQLIDVDVVDRLLDVLLLIGLDGRVLDANAAAIACYGYSREEIVGLSIRDIRAPADRAAIEAQMTAALVDGTQFETVHQRSDGTQFPVEVRSARVNVGDETALLSIVSDVSARRREEALSAARVRVAEFASGHSLNEMIQKALDEAKCLTSSQIGLVHMVAEDGTLRTPMLPDDSDSMQVGAEDRGSDHPAIGAGMWAECLRELRPVIHNGPESLSDTNELLPPGHPPIVRQLAVPVIRDGKPRLILGVGDKPTDYDEFDIAAIVRLADVVYDLVLAKRVEQEMADSELAYRSLVSVLNEGVILQSGDGTILTFNKAAADVFGIGPEQAIGETSSSREWGLCREDGTPLPGEEHPSMVTLRTGEPCSGVVLGVRGPLGLRTIEINTRPLCRQNAPLPYAVVVSFTDITERKRVLDELQESARWLNESQRIAKLGHYVQDIPHDTWEGSPALYEVLGVDPNGVHDVNAWLETVHPLDRERMTTYLVEEVYGRHESFDMQYRLARQGEYGDTWVHGVGKVEYSDDGQPLSMFGVIQDVSESKNAADAVARSQVLLTSSLESQKDTILLSLDTEYRYLYFNRAHAESMRLVYGAEPVLGTNVLDYITDDADRATAKENYDRALAGESHSNMRVYGELARVYYESYFNPLADESGAIIGATAMARDVTERIRAEEQLLAAQQDLQRSNRELEQFAYVASHDLQEPLRMVSSYLSLIRKRYQGQLDSDADDFIGFAVDGAARMQRLLEDLLAYSRVGTQGRPAVPVDSRSVAELAVANLQAGFSELDAQVVLGELPMVLADDVQLMRVFQNLINNGMKFHRASEPPRVEVTAERAQDFWRFSVTDNGIGIDAEHFEQVFEVFNRLSAASEYPGTGIGLAVCRRIVERHGGQIWVESSGETGTTFCFTLPAVEEM